MSRPRILLEVNGYHRELDAVEISSIIHDLQDDHSLKTRHDIGLVFIDEAVRKYTNQPTDSGWMRRAFG